MDTVRIYIGPNNGMSIAEGTYTAIREINGSFLVEVDGLRYRFAPSAVQVILDDNDNNLSGQVLNE